MSSLSSAFNSSSTLITIDFYKRAKPQASEKELVWIGQFATIILVLISLLYIPLIKIMTQSGGIIQYLQSVQAYISPPIAAAFLLGLFFKRINSRGAIISLWTGFVIGVVRLIFEFMVQNKMLAMGDNFLVDLIVAPNFLHFALYLFLFCSALLIVASLSAPQHSAEKLKGVTFDKTVENFFEVRRVDVIYTVGLILVVLAVWYIFSPLGIA